MEGNEDEICKICKISFKDKSDFVCIREKGTINLNNARIARGDVVEFVCGDLLHKKCRSDYINEKYILLSSKKKSDKEPSMISHRTRSSSEMFDFRNNCFLCGLVISAREKRDLNSNVINVSCKNREIDNSMIEIIKQRQFDDWAMEVNGRIQYVNDLRAEDAVYHKSCNSNFRTNKEKPKSNICTETRKRGRKSNFTQEDAFLKVTEELKENDDEQFTISELVEVMQKYCPEPEMAYSKKWMKKKLLEYFGEGIIIGNMDGKCDVITFVTTATKILSEFHDTFNIRSSDEEEQKRQIIETAAKLIKSDVKKIPNSKDYPSLEAFESIKNCLEYIPLSLRTFLRTMFSSENSEKKIAFIGQSIMQQIRPRTLLVPLPVAVSIVMHHQFASRFLIDMLYNMGFGTSYNEVSKFERNAAVTKGSTMVKDIDKNSFIQFVADNVDHNVRTLDGLNTFHGMGIISTVTPMFRSAVPIKYSDALVPRSNVSASEIVKIGKIELEYFTKIGKKIDELKFSKLLIEHYYDQNNIFDKLWISCWLLKPERPMWNGFMQMINSKKEHFGKSSVIFLPMIDMKSTDPTCILSTMRFVAKQAKDLNQTAVLTFDQPLYWKAMEIKLWEKDDIQIRNIVLVLGHFHTRKSFLGTIGHLMSGSGMDYILKLIYADNVVSHMLDGNAYSRAIRGYLLVAAGLHGILMSKMYQTELLDENGIQFFPNPPEDLKNLSEVFDETISGLRSAVDIETNKYVKELQQRLDLARTTLCDSKTARLWFQYLDMISILCKSIKAQRSGNWKLHLSSVQKMLPYFAASGHHHYLKSAYLYLQTMNDLKITHPGIYNHFNEFGLHIVRNSDKYWCGVSTDLVIEQRLMRTMKTTGGLTRGKGMGEVQRTIWLFSSPVCAQLNESLQNITGVQYITSEQHKETTHSRQQRDYKDSLTLSKYLVEHNPFKGSSELENIQTGEVSNSSTNIFLSEELGNKIVQNMEGINVFEYGFKTRDRATLMTTAPAIKIGDEKINVSTQLLFQRLFSFIVRDSTVSINEVFQHELSTFPASLFHEKDGLMRVADKPKLSSAIWSSLNNEIHMIPSKVHYVLDGGSLLHKIPSWPKGQTFKSICNLYIQYVKKHYKSDVCVVFDGGYDEPSTKDSTHLRRSKFKRGVKVNITESATLNMKKEEFLLNKINKQRFLEMLTTEMNADNIPAKQSSGDADLDIVLIDLKYAEYETTVIIAEDTDILCLLLYHATEKHDIYLTSERKSNFKENPKVWYIPSVRSQLGFEICSRILLIHAMLGCDTTSSIFAIGKASLFKKFSSDIIFCESADVFSKTDSTKTEVIKAGEKIILLVSGAKKELSLDDLRVSKYHHRLATNKNAILPETLGPTSDSASFHSLRVYYQVQIWMGRTEIDLLDWGWIRKGDYIMPTKMSKQAAPESLMNIIRCSCKTDCKGRCSCHKYDLKCSSMCKNCRGISCLNSRESSIEEDEDDIM